MVLQNEKLIYQISNKDKKRFLDKASVLNNYECWPWLACITRSGYGQFKFQQKKWSAHRFAFLLYYGYIIKKLYVCHSCDNIIIEV